MDISGAAKKLYHTAHPLSKGMFYSREERGPISWGFLVVLLFILCYGLLMLFSASYSTGYYYENGDSFYYIRQQLIYAGGGLIIMTFLSFCNYRWMRRFTWAVYIVTILLLIWALLTPSATQFHRWVNAFGVSFQPSEVAKLAVILFTAYLVDLHRERKNTLSYGILLPMLPLAPIVVPMIKEPHWSGTILILTIFFTILICAGCALHWMVAVIGAGGLGVAFLLMSQNNYVQTRLEGWTLLTGDTSKMTYQTRQSLYSIASGGWLGLGIGNSRQKHLWLPEATNDFIFSVLCEELGFLGAALCMGLFALLIFMGIRIALNMPDLYGTLLGVGIMGQIAWQVAFNIAVVTDSIPNTGISLPFFSSGGSSLIMLMAEMGIMLSLSRVGNARILAERRKKQQEFARQRNGAQVYRRGDTV